MIDHGRLSAQGTAASLKERVGGLILKVELVDAVRRDQAQAVLASVGCGEPEPDERADRLSRPAPWQGLELVERAAAALRQADIRVSSLTLRGPTLDDVFLQLTGAPPTELDLRLRRARGAGRLVFVPLCVWRFRRMS